MNIYIKYINTVVIDPNGYINAYKDNTFLHSLRDIVMKDCSIEVDDCKVRINGTEIEYEDGEYANLQGMSGKEINEKYANSYQIKPHPKIMLSWPFRFKIVRDWKFSDYRLRLRKSYKVVRVLSLNNFQLKIYRHELDEY